jgi:hypothetical protein
VPQAVPTVAAVRACQNTWTEARDLFVKAGPYLSSAAAASNENTVRIMTEVIVKLDPGPGRYDAYLNYCKESQLATIREQIEHVKAAIETAQKPSPQP